MNSTSGDLLQDGDIIEKVCDPEREVATNEGCQNVGL